MYESNGLNINLKKTKVMASGLKKEILKSKVNPCAKCCRRVMTNLKVYAKCGKWVYGRCAKMKNVTLAPSKDCICKRCVEVMKNIMEPWNQLELVKSFYYLGHRLNANGGSEAAKTVRIGWIQSRK